jgi:hypothetical protein
VPVPQKPYPLPRTPADLEPIVEALGQEVAVRFLMRFGGAELRLPDRPRGKSQVEAEIGFDAYLRLCEQRDRIQKRIPLGRRWIAKIMRSEGASVAEIARRIGTTDVTVRKWLKPQGERS